MEGIIRKIWKPLEIDYQHLIDYHRLESIIGNRLGVGNRLLFKIYNNRLAIGNRFITYNWLPTMIKIY